MDTVPFQACGPAFLVGHPRPVSRHKLANDGIDTRLLQAYLGGRLPFLGP